MPLSYGDIALTTPSAELNLWLSGQLPPLVDIFEFELPDYTTKVRGEWNFPGALPERQLKVNHLFWPTGASRFAFGHFLAHQSQLDQIRTLAQNSGTSARYRALTFKMNDGTNGIETSLYMLPPRPLAQLPGDPNGLYLLTLVDERYFWWEKAASIIVTGGTTTWATLLSSIATALGITLTYDTINSAYLKPSENLTSDYQFIPLLLDAVCSNVGQKFVRKLDGTNLMQSPTTAKTSQDRQVDSYTKQCGGKFAFKVTETPHDLAALVPANFTLLFPQPNSDVVYPITKALNSLSLTEFAGVTGHDGTKFYHDDAIYSGNLTELTNLTTQNAKDWYRFRLGRAEITYPGVIPYTPEGLSDNIEWTPVFTRIQRGPWTDYSENMNRHGTAGSKTDGPPPSEPPPGYLGDKPNRPFKYPMGSRKKKCCEPCPPCKKPPKKPTRNPRQPRIPRGPVEPETPAKKKRTKTPDGCVPYGYGTGIGGGVGPGGNPEGFICGPGTVTGISAGGTMPVGTDPGVVTPEEPVSGEIAIPGIGDTFILPDRRSIDDQILSPSRRKRDGVDSGRPGHGLRDEPLGGGFMGGRRGQRAAFSDVSQLPASMVLTEITINYTDLQTAATTKTQLLYTLPIKGTVMQTGYHIVTTFAGTLLVTISFSIGTGAANAKYMAGGQNLAAAADTTMQALYYAPPATPVALDSATATTAINMYVTSAWGGGNNLSNLTAGQVKLTVLSFSPS